MKKIMNYFVMGAAILGMSAALASCQKESAAPETPQAPEVHVIHVELNAAISDTKSNYDSGTKKVTIENDDQLYIALTGPESAWTATGTLTFATDKFSGDITVNTGSYSGSDPITDAKDLTATFLPKEYSTVGYLSAEGVATAANAFYAGAKDASVPQLVHLTATVNDQAGVAKSPLTLEPQNAVLCYTIAANKVIAGEHTVSVSDGTTTISGTVIAAADAATTFAVAFPDNATAKDYTMSVVSYEKVVKTGKTLDAGKVVNIPVSALTPLFSVAKNKYVKFSPGNLQYTISTSTWSFMANQYSTVETTDVGVDYAKQDVVSLFGWGTSGHKFASGYGTAYQPWSTSTTKTDYGPIGTYGLTGTYANGDWGIKNVIGDDAAGTWRTLTSAEWTYLLTETDRTDTRYCKATVNDVSGLVIFPDSYSHPTGVTAIASANTDDAAFTTNSWSGEDWTKMETAGAVFLPAAGRRNGTKVNDKGLEGRYWSSTPNGDSYASPMVFTSGGVFPSLMNSRSIGFSVRLVQNQ